MLFDPDFQILAAKGDFLMAVFAVFNVQLVGSKIRVRNSTGLKVINIFGM